MNPVQFIPPLCKLTSSELMETQKKTGNAPKPTPSTHKVTLKHCVSLISSQTICKWLTLSLK